MNTAASHAFCQSTKANGEPCRAHPVDHSAYCFTHNPASDKRRQAARRAGGVARNRKAVLDPKDAPDIPLNTPTQIVAFLTSTIHQLRRGEIDPSLGRVLCSLTNTLLKAISMAYQEPFSPLGDILLRNNLIYDAKARDADDKMMARREAERQAQEQDGQDVDTGSKEQYAQYAQYTQYAEEEMEQDHEIEEEEEEEEEDEDEDEQEDEQEDQYQDEGEAADERKDGDEDRREEDQSEEYKEEDMPRVIFEKTGGEAGREGLAAAGLSAVDPPVAAGSQPALPDPPFAQPAMEVPQSTGLHLRTLAACTRRRSDGGFDVEIELEATRYLYNTAGKLAPAELCDWCEVIVYGIPRELNPEGEVIARPRVHVTTSRSRHVFSVPLRPYKTGINRTPGGFPKLEFKELELVG